MIVGIAHFTVQNQDLRQQFAFLGWTCIVAGFTGILIMLLALAVFSMVFIVELIVDMFKK